MFVFLHNLEKLLVGAMLGLAADAYKQLFLNQLLVDLPKAISMQICVSNESSNLDKVMECAQLLLTVDNTNCYFSRKTNELSVLREQMDLLTE